MDMFDELQLGIDQPKVDISKMTIDKTLTQLQLPEQELYLVIKSDGSKFSYEDSLIKRTEDCLPIPLNIKKDYLDQYRGPN